MEFAVLRIRHPHLYRPLFRVRLGQQLLHLFRPVALGVPDAESAYGCDGSGGGDEGPFPQERLAVGSCWDLSSGERLFVGFNCRSTAVTAIFSWACPGGT